MDLNGDRGAIEEIHSLQRETIPPVQLESSGIGLEGAVFLQAEEDIGIRRTVQAIRGDVAPIVHEQEQLRQDIQDFASDAANVLYNTAVRSE